MQQTVNISHIFRFEEISRARYTTVMYFYLFNVMCLLCVLVKIAAKCGNSLVPGFHSEPVRHVRLKMICQVKNEAVDRLDSFI